MKADKHLIKSLRSKELQFSFFISLFSLNKFSIPKNHHNDHIEMYLFPLAAPVFCLNYDIRGVNTSSNEHSPHILIVSQYLCGSGFQMHAMS